MDVTGNDELGELAKNGEGFNLMANCGETSVLQVELTFCLRYLFCHSCYPDIGKTKLFILEIVK